MWSLKLAKESFKFSGAHFTTFSKTEAETLHGHNYYVSIDLIGCKSLTHGMIIDLNEPKKIIKSLLESMDEKVLVAKLDPFTKIKTDNSTLSIQFNGKDYSFPLEDCFIVPAENITIEELAHFISKKLKPHFESYPLTSFSVEVAETRGQSCVYKQSLNEKQG